MDKQQYFCGHCYWAGDRPLVRAIGGTFGNLCPRCKNYVVNKVPNAKTYICKNCGNDVDEKDVKPECVKTKVCTLCYVGKIKEICED